MSIGERRKQMEAAFHQGAFRQPLALPMSDVQAGMLGVGDEALETQVGVLRDAAVLQGVLRGAVRVARYWRPGWEGLVDFDERRLVRHGPSLAWDPGCGCITGNLKVEWAQDVSVPSVMLRLDLHARRPADR